MLLFLHHLLPGVLLMRIIAVCAIFIHRGDHASVLAFFPLVVSPALSSVRVLPN